MPSIADIAQAYGLGEETVENLRDKTTTPKTSTLAKFTDVSALESTKQAEEAAKQLAISTAMANIAQMGLETAVSRINTGNRWSREDVEKLLNGSESGYAPLDLVKEFAENEALAAEAAKAAKEAEKATLQNNVSRTITDMLLGHINIG